MAVARACVAASISAVILAGCLDYGSSGSGDRRGTAVGTETALWFLDRADDGRPVQNESWEFAHGHHLGKRGTLDLVSSPQKRYGEGYEFDGVGDRLVQRDGALRIGGDLTIFLVFDLFGQGKEQNLVSWGAAGDDEAENTLYALQVDASNEVSYGHEHGQGNEQDWDVNNVWFVGDGRVGPGFHKLVLVRDSRTQHVVVRVDGERVIDRSYELSPDGGELGELSIGHATARPDDVGWFDGRIYELRIWNKVVDVEHLEAKL